VVAPHWSVGADFQSNRYGARTSEPGGATKVQMTNVQAELYYYRDRNQDASQYLVLGVGFYRPELHNDAEEVSFPGENLLLTVGVGAELFFKENWGLDIGARALGYLGDGFTDQEKADAALQIPGNFSFAIQGQIGLLYYLLR
jgi:opacity protein-like surface antigen